VFLINQSLLSSKKKEPQKGSFQDQTVTLEETQAMPYDEEMKALPSCPHFYTNQV
jgi:hypothetical protein